MSNDIPTATRHAVIERDFNRCVVCSGQGTEIQHRMRRREGKHGLGNLVRICSGCHRKVHAEPEWATARGLTVPTWVERAHIELVPVKTWRGWVFITDEGFMNFHIGAPIVDALEHYQQREAV